MPNPRFRAWRALAAAVAAGLVAGTQVWGAVSAGTPNYIQNENGRLTFPADANGYKIPDFSRAGYLSSNAALPKHGVEYRTEVSLANPSGDETARIQNAIATVAKMTPNAAGYRGAVTLSAGTWHVSNLVIDADGVVLRGAGAEATIITSASLASGQTLRVGASSSELAPDSFMHGRSVKTWNITSSVVHVGDASFTIASGHTLQKGDAIIIEHPSTAAWLAAVQHGGSSVKSEYWPTNSVPIRYHRYVTAVNGDTITIDAPVMYSLVKSLSQSFVYKYAAATRQKVGLENLTVDHQTKSNLDSAHANDCIRFNRAENCWVRNVTVTNFKRAGFFFGESTRITVVDSKALDPHSVIDSAMRYGFMCSAGQLILFQDCYGRRNRHTFVTNGHAMDSGNVYLRCVAEDAYAASEAGHQRWASGHLWDGCSFRNVGTPESGAKFSDMMLWLGNHGDNSNGHGWAAVTGVAYRSKVASPGFAIVAKPPTGMNYAIACEGDWRSSHAAHGTYAGALDIRTAGTLPASLFAAQLAQRLGELPGDPEDGPKVPLAPSDLKVAVD